MDTYDNNPNIYGSFASDGSSFSNFGFTEGQDGQIKGDYFFPKLTGTAGSNSFSVSGGGFSMQATFIQTFSQLADAGGVVAQNDLGSVISSISASYNGQTIDTSNYGLLVSIGFGTLRPPSSSWAGPVSGNWSTASNWSPGLVPVASTDANFNTSSASGYTVTLSTASACNNLLVQGDNVGLNTAGNNLSVAGSVSVMPNASAGSPGSLTIISGGVAGGALNVANGVTVASGSYLRGNGTIVGNVLNAGTSAPGYTTPGALNIQGNYTQAGSGKLLVGINGNSSSGAFGSLATTTASLSGKLSVNLSNGYVPNNTDSYNIVTASQSSNGVSGIFSNAGSVVNVLNPTTGKSSGQFDVSYNNSNVSLSNFHRIFTLSYGIKFPQYVDSNGKTQVGLQGGLTALNVSKSYENVVGVVSSVHESQLSYTTPPQNAASNFAVLQNDITTMGTEIHSGDLAIIYLASHGGFAPTGVEAQSSHYVPESQGVAAHYTTATGSSYLCLSNLSSGATLDPTAVLYPTTLYSMFNTSQWTNVNKLFVIDSCYSGGFWAGPGGSPGYLSGLSHSAIIYSAPEDNVGYFSDADGQEYLGVALQQVLGYLGNHNESVDFNTLLSDVRRTVSEDAANGFTNGFASDFPLQSDLLTTGNNVGGDATSDFSLDLAGGEASVPEPSTTLLAAVGSCSLLRRRQKTFEGLRGWSQLKL